MGLETGCIYIALPNPFSDGFRLCDDILTDPH